MEMAAALFATVGSAFGIGGSTAAAGTAAAAGTVGAAATTGSTIASILQGTATALSIFSGIGAANQEATSLELAANDAERGKALETLQGIDRRTSIKQAMMQQVGEQNTAYAASGVDLTFGTPSQARSEAFRQADLGLETSNGTEQTRVARLDERAANLRAQAKGKRRSGILTGLTQGLGGAADILGRG